MWNTVAVIQCLVLDVHDFLLGNELLSVCPPYCTPGVIILI